ncbi:MAG: hypothetical protein B6I22_08065 [Desulfobacteraceae bacterium 4572_123]|nr:MAG: hypothetical protein B6I22_08065 [Desulfobacteraceae bacterium 4572_123]
MQQVSVLKQELDTLKQESQNTGPQNTDQPDGSETRDTSSRLESSLHFVDCLKCFPDHIRSAHIHESY